jgi:hypothetical protein
MPSMRRASSMFRAEVRATRAARANSSHEARIVLSMFGVCVFERCRNERWCGGPSFGRL